MGDDTTLVLTGVDNYQMWKIRILAKLRAVGAGRIVTGEETRPLTTTVYPQAHGTTTVEAWDLRAEKAHGILVEHISDAIALKFADCADVQELYRAITKEYEQTNTTVLAFYTWISLANTRWDGTSSIDDHIGRLLADHRRLTSLKKPMDDEFLAYALLNSLPSNSRWDTFRTTILSAIPIGQSLTFHDVDARIHAEVTRTTSSSSESALKASGSAPKQSGKKHCSQHGFNDSHTTDECRVLKSKQDNADGKRKKKKKKRTDAHKVVEHSDSDSDSASVDSDTSAQAHHVHISKSLRKRIQAYLASDTPRKSTPILIDSGASAHMVPERGWFVPGSYKLFTTPHDVRFGDSSKVHAIGKGSVTLLSEVNGKEYETVLSNVLLVPSFTIALISVQHLCERGLNVLFSEHGGRVRLRDGTHIMAANVKCGLYHLEVDPLPRKDQAMLAVDINVLHRRFAHISVDRLRRMVSKGQLKGIDTLTGEPKFCEPCAMGKMHKLPFKSRTGNRATRPLQFIHSDVGGMVDPSRQGFRYWITFTDEHNRFVWVLFMKHKSEAQDTYNRWKADVEAFFREEVGEISLSPNFVQFLRTDNGGEYTSKAFEAQLRKEGVLHETMAADTPEQNGMAERVNQTLVNQTVAMLIESGLPKSFWADAMQTAAYVMCRSPAKGLKGRTPYQTLFGEQRKIDTSFFHPFGCPAYALIPKDQRKGKFAPKGRKCIFLGYEYGKHAYKLMDVTTRKVFSSRHVQFNENGDPPAEFLNELGPEPADHGKYDDILCPRRPAPVRYDEPVFIGPVGAPVPPPDAAEPVGAPPPPPVGPVGAPQPPPHLPRDGTPSRIPRRVSQAVQPQQAPPPPPPLQPSPVRTPRPAPLPQRRVSAPPQAPVPVRQSGRERRKADKNRDYNRTLQDEEQRRQQRRVQAAVPPPPPQAPETPHPPAPPSPELQPLPQNAPPEHIPDIQLPDLPEMDADEVFFAGISSTGPRNHELPSTLREAFSTPEGEHWRAALEEELQNLRDNCVYETVPIPSGVKPITSKPVLRVKFDKNGGIERYKIRIVARGFTQKPGIDYQDVFAPVANLESVRIILALAARYDLELDQMDVSAAYLNGELDEELYLMPPDGVAIEPGHCWRLKRSLYGLKQAGRTWNKTLDRKLTGLGFNRLDSETCLYVFRDDKGQLCFLVVYVDDLLLAATSRAFMDEVKRKLTAQFKMRDLGEASYILGIAIRRDCPARAIYLSQRQYIDTVLDRYGMKDCKPQYTHVSQCQAIRR